jgi:hypothetical protein
VSEATEHFSRKVELFKVADPNMKLGKSKPHIKFREEKNFITGWS